MNNFFKVIFYIIIFYYVFKFFAKLLFPIVIKKVVQKAGQKFQQQYDNQNTASQDEIIVDRTKSNKSKTNKNVGEYIDYEEIK